MVAGALPGAALKGRDGVSFAIKGMVGTMWGAGACAACTAHRDRMCGMRARLRLQVRAAEAHTQHAGRSFTWGSQAEPSHYHTAVQRLRVAQIAM